MLTGFDLCRAALAVTDISAPEKSVLMVLAIMADREDATCFPPINGPAGLTAKTCLSERAVQRAIQRLKDLGHISRKQLRHGCIYTVHPSSTPATGTGVSETPDTETPVGGTPDTQAARGAPLAPKLPTTTIPKKASPFRKARAPKAEAFRMPADWKPVRFSEDSVARAVIDRRGQDWARAALESFRAWAANAADEDGKGRKLDWQAAWGKWVIRQDSDDGRSGTQRVGGNGVSRSGHGRTVDAAQRVLARRGSHRPDPEQRPGDAGGAGPLLAIGGVGRDG